MLILATGGGVYLLLVMVGGGGSPTPTPTATRPAEVCACRANLYKCADFDTQAEAQICFDSCMATVSFDVHRLDGDRDGVACEGLP